MTAFRIAGWLSDKGNMLFLSLIFSVLFFSQSFVFAADEQLDFANGLFHRGFYKEALDEYQRWLDASPAADNAHIAWLRLGRCAMALNDHEQAVRAFEQAAQMAEGKEERGEAWTSAGEALFFQGDYQGAIGWLEKAGSETLTPEGRSRALFYLGRAKMEAGDLLDAAASLSTLIKELPDSTLIPFAHYHLAFVRVKLDSVEEGAKEFSAVANLPQADESLRMESRFRAAELYDKLGWTDAALGAYEMLRRDFPDSDYARRADYGYAWALYHSARYEESLAAVSAFLTSHGDSAQAPGMRYLQGNNLQQLRRHEEAIQSYERLRQDAPDSAFAIHGLYKSAWARQALGQVSEAREAAEAYLAAGGDGAYTGEITYLLGILHISEGDYEEALDAFGKAIVESPDSEFTADALFKSAECYAHLGLRDEAARHFEEFARRYPDHSLTEQAMLRSGDARFTAQDFAQAIENYKKILENPQDAALEEEALFRLAVTCHNSKSYEESVDAFRRLLDKFGEGRYGGEAAFRIAEYELTHSQDPLKALEFYEKALSHEPDPETGFQVLQGMAAARYAQKDYEKAGELILRLVREHPHTPLKEDSYLWSGQWFEKEQRYGEAAEVFQALLKANPDHGEKATVLFFLAQCLEKEEKIQEATATYRLALEAGIGEDQESELLFRLGALYEKAGDKTAAREMFEKAANLDSGESAARARFHLAELFEKEEAFEEAARNYMRLAILFVHKDLSPEALWRAGNCYLKMDQSDQAQSVFEELQADYPDSPFAAQAKELLKEGIKKESTPE
ncbi:MAG: tetratricopeptide repeat protein [Candidatus Hydrogenedens sp.]|nr:tetratricopeptide repeat protein [Candidatus Hydrogenedens sp.]